MLAACLVFWNLVLSVNKDIIDRDEGESADLNKILGAGVTLAGGVMKAVEGYDGIRAASLGVEPSAIIKSNGWKLTSNVLGGAAGLLSIWDGLKKLGEATQASRTGQSLSARNNMIMGGVGVVGGIASIVVIGASAAIGLGVGLFFSILTLLLGYWFITLVAPSVEMWVNRSLIGNHEGQIRKFEDITAEQSSLEMVFQGVVVELSWSHDNPGTNPGGTLGISSKDMMRTVDSKEKHTKISLKIVVPNLKEIDLNIQLYATQNLNSVFDWSYKKHLGSDSLDAVSERSQPRFSNAKQPEFTSKKDSFQLQWDANYSKQELGESVELRFFLGSQKELSSKNDVFKMRLQ